MKDIDLFSMALGLSEPWIVERTEFKPAEHRLDLYLGFKTGSKFTCPTCDYKNTAYDTIEKTWQHLNFFQHEAYIHARVPRVDCKAHGVHMIDVPWARKGSGFTLLFEALVMIMVKEMSVKGVSRIIGTTDTRLWRVLEHYVDADLAKQDLSEVTKVGFDETASKRGHSYITVAADLETGKAIFVTEGKDAATIMAFVTHLEAHGGSVVAIKEVCSDMSPAFISGIEEHLPEAAITFDRFHVMKLLGEAVNKVRKEEAKSETVLRGSKYVWLSNQANLSAQNLTRLKSLAGLQLKTAKAWRMMIIFKGLFDFSAERAIEELGRWRLWAARSKLAPIVDFARMLKKHWGGVVRWLFSGLTNGLLESLNSLIQAAKSRARGYRTVKNLKIMTYIVAGKLGQLPT
jgi:transposase